LKLFFLFFLPLFLYAGNNYSLRISSGKATLSDFSEIIVANWKGHVKNLTVVSLDGGYKLKEHSDKFPVDIYAKMGLSYYDEDSMRDNNIAFRTYVKAYKNFDFFHNRIRFGFGEGISYTKNILYTEYYEAKQEKDNNSKFLNYLDVSLDIDIGKLFIYKPLYNTYIGWNLEHRSGIFGLINNVRRGGSNYNTLSIEKTF